MLIPSILLSLLFILPASASPKGRLKVKYRVKPGGDKVMVKTVSEEENVEEMLTNEVDGDALMLEARDLLMASTPDSYKQTVTTIVGQLQRAARSQDLSVNNRFHSNNYDTISFSTLGDIIFDVVKEVVAEQISGLLSRSLGISTARSSGSIMETVFRYSNLNLTNLSHFLHKLLCFYVKSHETSVSHNN